MVQKIFNLEHQLKWFSSITNIKPLFLSLAHYGNDGLASRQRQDIIGRFCILQNRVSIYVCLFLCLGSPQADLLENLKVPSTANVCFLWYSILRLTKWDSMITTSASPPPPPSHSFTYSLTWLRLLENSKACPLLCEILLYPNKVWQKHRLFFLCSSCRPALPYFYFYFIWMYLQRGLWPSSILWRQLTSPSPPPFAHIRWKDFICSEKAILIFHLHGWIIPPSYHFPCSRWFFFLSAASALICIRKTPLESLRKRRERACAVKPSPVGAAMGL